MATITASGYPGNARAVHAGVFTKLLRADYNGRSMSAGDAILLGVIDPKAIILKAEHWGGDGGAATYHFGTSLSLSILGAAQTISANAVATVFTPKAISSLSADSEQVVLPIIATKVAGTVTATGSVNLLLWMMMPSST